PTGSGTPALSCSKYVIVVSQDGAARVTAEDDAKPLRINARPRVEKESLRLAFVSYDESDDMSRVGLGAFDAWRVRFAVGEPLATLSRDTSGRVCLNFEKLESKLKTKTLCMTAPAP